VKECTKAENEEQGPIPLGPVGPVVPDKAVQRVLGKIGIPGPIISFDGNSNLCGCSPPDPNGAVGPNHVVTMSNLHFQIFDKSGNSLLVPQRTTLSGRGSAGIARLTMPAIRSCFMISWQTAGFLRSLPAVAQPSLSASQSRRRTIQLDRFFGMPFRLELIFPTIRKVGCGRMPTTSALAN